MRFKAVPAPPDDPLEGLAAAHDALPRVPRPETDCCGRIVQRVDWIEDRDAATEWLTFLRALALAESSRGGYARVRRPIEPGALAGPFSDGVFGAEEALQALDTEDPRDADAVFDALAPVVPEWERRRRDEWESVWLSRTCAILNWAVAFGLAQRKDGAYMRSAAADGD